MMTDSHDQNLQPGTRIDHYQIREILGVGGFGVTYKAWDESLQRDVAIKEFLPAELAVRDSVTATVRARTDKVDDYRFALDKFLQEARTLARFSHPNIVRVNRFLEANGTGYMVMDFEEGESLSVYLKRHPGPVPEAQLKAWFAPLLRGLVEVHKVGFLHRDIKPGNIYLRNGGEPLLIDFGAARQAIGEHSRSVTGIVSAGYAPTEQYSSDGSKQGPWTDLYAVGATLYRCMTGRDPLDAPHRQSVVAEEEPDPLVPASQAGAGQYSTELLGLVDWMLSLPMKKRPQSAQQVLDSLASEAQGEPRSTQVTRLVSQESKVAQASGNAQHASDPARHTKVKRWFLPLGLVVAIVLGVFVGLQQLRREDAPAPAPVQPVMPESAERVSPVPAEPPSDPAPAPGLTREQLLSGDSIVSIDSTPSGAKVLLDGIEIGETPFRHQQVRAGDYTLTLRHPNSQDYEQPVSLSADRVFSHDATLEAATGALTVLSEPAGAGIELDGKRLDQTTPATLEGIAAGPHRIRVLKDRYQPGDREVTVAADGVSRDMHWLEEIAYGTLTLDLTPKTARVTLPDIEPAYSPGMELPVGTYRVQVSAPGHKGYSGQVEVTPTGTTESIRLTYIPRLSEQVGKVFRDKLQGGGEGPEMVVLPTGKFRMGDISGYSDEKPEHEVTISRPIAMMKYEVSFAEYDRYAQAAGKTQPDDEGWGRDSRPVINVSWEDARGYAKWLSAQTGNTYRLPTESEWEYAARGGTSTKYSWGNTASHDYANYGKDKCCAGLASGKDRWEYTSPAGSFAPNAWGLYDVHGNVWEWVQDCWHDNYRGAPTDGTAWESGGDCAKRVLRGGSWVVTPGGLRSANRLRDAPSFRYNSYGFRLVQDLDS